MQQIRLRPSHPFLICGAPESDLPDLDGDLVTWSKDCFLVLTQAGADGPIELLLARSGERPDPPSMPTAEGEIQVRGNRLVVRDAEGETFAELDSLPEVLRCRIWANDSSEPNRIELLLG